MKCEAHDNLKVCEKKARFKIIDIVCNFDYTSEFWVCNGCLKYFINQEEENPHYIILEENSKKD